MKAVRAYLQGGLGNQCFIYAAARALALDAHANLFLDVGRFCDDHVFCREFELKRFNCEECKIQNSNWATRKLFNKLANEKLRLLHRLFRIVKEPVPARYEKLPVNWHGTLRLDGYWQSEKYFLTYRDVLARELELRDHSWLKRDAVVDSILKTENSIFVHMRSYCDIPGKTDYSNALPIGYYQNALQILKSRIGGGTVYLFSDDIEWARKRSDAELKRLFANFKFVYVKSCDARESNGLIVPAHIRDFCLMRLCKHGVIANSSFSWWAGWLGELDRLQRGEVPLRVRVNRRQLNDDLWPERWIAADL